MRGPDDKMARLECHPTAQGICKCSVMRAQLSVLSRDAIGKSFRDIGTDFCWVMLKWVLCYGVDWRGIGEVD